MPLQAYADQLVTFEVAWGYGGSSVDLAGFRFYSGDESVCETSDPDARSLQCEMVVSSQVMPFSMTAFNIYGAESEHSEIFWLDFSNYLDADNSPPVAKLEASSISGATPLLVSFDGSGSTDPGGYVVSFSWDFGDGQAGEGELVDHTFYSPGDYVVALTVIDDAGVTAETEIVVSVSDYGQPAGDSDDDDVDFLQAVLFPGANVVGGGCSVSYDPAAPGEAGAWLLLLLAGTVFAIVKRKS